MPKLENTSPRAKSVVFIDYKPAELRIGKDWLIIYYAKNPVTNVMERHRLRVPAMTNKKERLKHGHRIVVEINKKLAADWSPYLESPGKIYRSFQESSEKFLEQVRKEIKDGIKREDTYRAYKSYLSMIGAYIKEKAIKITFVIEIDRNFAVNYLDWIYYDRGNSPTTYNNHLLFLKNFCNFLISRGYMKENPTREIQRKKELKKKREVITPKIKKHLAENLPILDFHYYVLCMLTYYCMIRRTELTKLKVSDVYLDYNYISISSIIGKNTKADQYVTIPEEMKGGLMRHLYQANANDFLFSKNDFKPGHEQLKPKKITDTWGRIQKILGIPKEFQFYSLKDTGITDLFDLGISPLKIRDQARHSDLKQTERYTPKTKAGDTSLINSGVSFSKH
jgi:integrase/recombinase XerD